MINEHFLKRKISLIQDDLVKLSSLAKDSFDEIMKDFIKQAAVERILERIVNRAIDINQYLISELTTKSIIPPKNYRETFLRVSELGIYNKEFAEETAKSIGTRNILVHEYDNVNYSLIYSSINDCLKDYHQYCEYILKFIKKH